MSEETRTSIHGQWSSRMTFILAATGSAVGLGNIWKFPYITGENGGGAFVIVYLICIALIGVPIMMAEIMLGRRGRQSPINTMSALAAEEGRHQVWVLLGWFGVIAGFLILSYYSVIAGWTMSYVFRTAAGVFTGATADGIDSIFNEFVSSPESVLAWHTIFMVITMIIVSRGIKHGIERAVTYLMPSLFILLLVLLFYSYSTGYFLQGLEFLFTADFSKLTSNSILVAMGHAFFTLSLGMGAIMVYGSYLPKDTSIAKSTVMIALADTFVALLAGMVIFPIVFANQLSPAEGPGLIFKTLPIAFGQMEAGILIGTLFFILLVFAALSSSISLIEPAVAWLVENKNMSRILASVWCGIGAWVLGIGSVLSFSLWQDSTWSLNVLGMQIFDEKNIFQTLDGLTANIMLPLGGLFIAIFAGWLMKVESSKKELNTTEKGYTLWLLLIRVVAPIAVMIIFLTKLKL